MTCRDTSDMCMTASLTSPPNTSYVFKSYRPSVKIPLNNLATTPVSVLFGIQYSDQSTVQEGGHIYSSVYNEQECALQCLREKSPSCVTSWLADDLKPAVTLTRGLSCAQYCSHTSYYVLDSAQNCTCVSRFDDSAGCGNYNVPVMCTDSPYYVCYYIPTQLTKRADTTMAVGYGPGSGQSRVYNAPERLTERR